MPIRYALYENNLTTDPADYAAVVQISGAADLEAVAQRITEQGSTVTKADILGVLEGEARAVESLLADGWRVNLPLVSLFPRIRGVFNGPTDAFQAARHQVDVAAVPGGRLRASVRAHAQVQKVEAGKPAPLLLEYTDVNSGEVNGPLTPGGIGRLRGSRLKFDPADAAQGIFFVPESGPAVRLSMVATNKPGELVFGVPAGLAAGDYRLGAGSAAIDAGDQAGVPPAPPVDMDGDARPIAGRVDIGADESYERGAWRWYLPLVANFGPLDDNE